MSTSSFSQYRTALTTPGAGLPALASVLTRLPIAMIGLALLFYVQRTTGSFAIAGAVTAAALVGVSVGSVVQGRLIDRFGPTRPLLVVCVLFVGTATAVIAAVQAGAAARVMVALAFALGATEPMVGTASRALWTRLLPPGRVRDAALAYEAISMEVFFILGPALAGLLSATTMLWPGTGVLVGAAAMLFGAIAFALTPAVRRWPARPADRTSTGLAGMLGAIRVPGMRTLVLAAFGFGLTVGMIEVAVPAAATMAGRPGVSGLLLGVLSVSSVLAGLWYGVRPWPRRLAWRLPVLLLGFAVVLPLLAVPSGLIGLAVALLVVGMFVTPQATTHSLVIDAVAPRETAAEAFGWVIMAITLGLAVGQFGGGWLVELSGPDAAFLVAGAAGAVLAGLVWLRRESMRPAGAAAEPVAEVAGPARPVTAVPPAPAAGGSADVSRITAR